MRRRDTPAPGRSPCSSSHPSRSTSSSASPRIATPRVAPFVIAGPIATTLRTRASRRARRAPQPDGAVVHARAVQSVAEEHDLARFEPRRRLAERARRSRTCSTAATRLRSRLRIAKVRVGGDRASRPLGARANGPANGSHASGERALRAHRKAVRTAGRSCQSEPRAKACGRRSPSKSRTRSCSASTMLGAIVDDDRVAETTT